VKQAQTRFGGFDATCIRSGIHLTRNIFQVTTEDMQSAYDGNVMSDFKKLFNFINTQVFTNFFSQDITYLSMPWHRGSFV
jgi:hypothetical protein